MKKMFFLLLAIGLYSTAYSRDSSSGCGPGWYLFKKNSLISSALRATTNGILIPTVTLGMTSGTSNCSKHSIVKTEQESLKYATENYYELISQVAQGNGEFLNQFSDVIGCNRSSIDTFKKELRSNFNKIFPKHEANSEKLLLETYKIILNNKTLLYSCSLT